jgi:hypothetical protein
MAKKTPKPLKDQQVVFIIIAAFILIAIIIAVVMDNLGVK